MIDIAEIHRKSTSKKILGKFFNTTAYKSTSKYLLDSGYTDEQVTVRHQAYRGAVGIARVHPLVAIEYFRWADFNMYASWVQKKIDA